jgi:hypothetical protein
MIHRALLSAIAACFAVAACTEKPAEAPKPQAAAVVPLPPEAPKAAAASANQDAKPPEVKQAASMAGCRHGNCKIDIKVTEGATPCATATPDSLPVFKDNKGDDIKWSISTPGWKFVDKPQQPGIEWKDSSQQQFSGNAGGNSNNYKWKDANTDKNTYRYTIHVVNGDKKCDADPSIVNGAAS